MLDPQLVRDFVAALLQIPNTDQYGTRSNLLSGIPNSIMLTRDANNANDDFTMLIGALDRLGRLESGGRPLVILAENALGRVRGFPDVQAVLTGVLNRLNEHYAGVGQNAPREQVPTATLAAAEAARQEELILGDNRLPQIFLEGALRTARSVALLTVPRLTNGTPRDKKLGFGTGWLVAPDLLITNYHVVEARDRNFEPAASKRDREAQARAIKVWFDYHSEGDPSRLECNRGVELVDEDETLDYAILRLHPADTAKVADRRPLPVTRPPKVFSTNEPLNIVQYEGAKPLLYAIRSNFYMGSGAQGTLVHYLTATDEGASGSPVLDDTWQVVALHHGSQKVPLTLINKQEVRVHNEGIAIYAIIDHLADSVKQEIRLAQQLA